MIAPFPKQVMKMVAPKKVYLRYCEGAIESLRSQYEMTKVIAHNGSAGSAREAILRDFLVAHLPEMSTAISGVLFDSEGTYSKQQDIVFVLKSFPRLPFANGSDLIYVEGVIATIEIKTTIHPSTWKVIAPNIESVRALAPTKTGSAVFGDLDWDESRIFSAVITYDGSALKDIKNEIVKRPENSWPDVYLDLNQGMLIRNSVYLMAAESDEAFIEVTDPALAFARFLTFLTRITGRLVMRGVDWNAYLE